MTKNAVDDLGDRLHCDDTHNSVACSKTSIKIISQIAEQIASYVHMILWRPEIIQQLLTYTYQKEKYANICNRLLSH